MIPTGARAHRAKMPPQHARRAARAPMPMAVAPSPSSVAPMNMPAPTAPAPADMGAPPAYRKGGKVAMAKGGKFIQSAIKKPGQLHRDLGVPQGEKIPEKKLEAAAKRPGKVGQRARFAETLKGMKHAKGGKIEKHDDAAADRKLFQQMFKQEEAKEKPQKYAAGGVARARNGMSTADGQQRKETSPVKSQVRVTPPKGSKRTNLF